MAMRKSITGTGRAIRVLRKSAGMTLDDVAATAGISTNYLSRVENGRVAPSADWVSVVVAAIGSQIKDAA